MIMIYEEYNKKKYRKEKKKINIKLKNTLRKEMIHTWLSWYIGLHFFSSPAVKRPLPHQVTWPFRSFLVPWWHILTVIFWSFRSPGQFWSPPIKSTILVLNLSYKALNCMDDTKTMISHDAHSCMNSVSLFTRAS